MRKKSTSSKSKKNAVGNSKGHRFTAKIFSVLIYFLALYGAHSLFREYCPPYSEKLLHISGGVSNSAKSLSDKISPLPTVVIKNAADAEKSKYDNLHMGVPGFRCDVILDRNGYALGYSEKHEQPLWVAYKLTADEVKNKKAKRSGDFQEDPFIPGGSATLADYKGSMFDRGHLAPAADMSFSLQAMSESFYMSNMSPQHPDFNRGVWKDLESKVRDYALACGEIYVVSGPVFEDDKTYVSIGKNQVSVPEKYYKVLLDANAAHPKAIGFILSNKGSKNDLSTFAVSVDAVEYATGLNFFNRLPPADEYKLESSCNIESWEQMIRKKSRSGAKNNPKRSAK